MLGKEGDPDAYELIADQLGYDTVGAPASSEARNPFKYCGGSVSCRVCSEDDLKFSEYRQSGDLGPLSERRWEREIAWVKPEKESAPCWFVSNAGVQEKDTVEPKFLSRSLATLRVLLKNARLATSQKIKAEYEGRKQRNAEACAVLEANFHMWRHVGGPRWDYLKDPSDEALHRAQDAKAHLIAIRDQQDGADNAGTIASECIKAVAVAGGRP